MLEITNNNQNINKLLIGGKRKKWVDFGKGISMFLVVLYHSEVYYPITNYNFSYLFAYFRMPFFFFLSGYLFTSNYLQFSLKRKMLQILRGIVWTYLIFTLILFVPKSISHNIPLSVGLQEIVLGWASWFVVALGLAQVMFGWVLSKTKNHTAISTFSLVCLILGYCISIWYPERLPYYFDRALLIVPFFGLGFFYRIYENIVDRYVPVKWWVLLLLAVCYFGFYIYDSMHWHTMTSAFGAKDYHNFMLYLCYAVLGIMMMVRFVKLVPPIPWICFIGVNSLVFYYLNGGAITIIVAICNRLNLHLPIAIQQQFGYIEILFMAVITSLMITVVVKFIRRYCPVMIGDKNAFNHWAKKLRLKIKF